MKVIFWLCLLCACTRTTELLPRMTEAAAPREASVPDRTVQPYCPTSIDVFGGRNVSLAGCGGGRQVPAPLEDGYFAPGTADYDASLAGRLYARLVDDPELVPRFGSAWTVRSCSPPVAMLAQITPGLADDQCGQDGMMVSGSLLGICSNHPAPVLLLEATMLDDRCHGGGPDSSEPDDPEGFARHLALRLDSVLASYGPQVALVGPTIEWTPTPIPGFSQSAACSWSRPDWESAGVSQWLKSRVAPPAVRLVKDCHDEFKGHSSCCSLLGVACDTGYTSDIGQVNCDGAQQLVDVWYGSLKQLLLANDYTCRPDPG